MSDLPITSTSRAKPGLVALFVGILVLGLKLLAYAVTGSQAVFSDALESIVNVVAAAAAYALIWYGSKPADRNHPYGHGKSEFFSSSFEGGLIACAAVLIILRSLRAIFFDHQLNDLNSGILIIAAAGFVNLLLGIYLLRRGKTLQSEALKASSAHVMSDTWTSAATLIGLFLVQVTGVVLIDPLVALAMGIYLAWIGFRIVRRSLGALLDEEDVGLLKAFSQSCNQVTEPGLIQIHAARIMRSGNYNFIDAHIVVPEFWDVKTAHDKVNAFERRLMAVHSHPGEIHFHNDPCRRAHCRNCDLPDCPIRAEQFVQRRAYTPENVAAEKATG